MPFFSSLTSAVVLNYRTPQLAVRCVQALLRQDMPDGLEILVVDNHSCDDSIGVLRNRLRSFPNVRILESPRNLGYARGNTLALTRARGEYLLVINPDNELEPMGLSRMVAAMEEDPAIGILAPRLLHEDGTVRDSYRTFPTVTDLVIKRTFLRRIFCHRMRRHLQWDQDPTAARDTDWVVGACLLIRRSLLKEIGPLDPQFFLFFEDIDFCRRCWMVGKHVVYFPGVTATDRKRRLSEGGLLSLLLHRTGRTHVRSALSYFWKWKGKPLPVH